MELLKDAILGVEVDELTGVILFLIYDDMSKAYRCEKQFSFYFFLLIEERSLTLKTSDLVWMRSSICLFLMFLYLWYYLILLEKVSSALFDSSILTDFLMGTAQNLLIENNYDFMFYSNL